MYVFYRYIETVAVPASRKWSNHSWKRPISGDVVTNQHDDVAQFACENRKDEKSKSKCFFVFCLVSSFIEDISKQKVSYLNELHDV